MSRFTILMYHMVLNPVNPQEAKYACPPKLFAQHMQLLTTEGYNVISLKQIEDHLYQDKPLPDNAIAITLDDGFQDNYTHAFDIFKHYQIPATIFLAVDKISQTNDWMVGSGFPSRPMLTWDQVTEMQDAGISFGSHTLSHPKLDQLNEELARIEIEQSKQILASKLASDIKWFAYPYGLYKTETVNRVRESGYSLACSTLSGFNRKDVDPLLLRRIEVYGTDPVWKLRQKIKYGFNDAHWAFPARYYLSRLIDRIQGN